METQQPPVGLRALVLRGTLSPKPFLSAPFPSQHPLLPMLPGASSPRSHLLPFPPQIQLSLPQSLQGSWPPAPFPLSPPSPLTLLFPRVPLFPIPLCSLWATSILFLGHRVGKSFADTDPTWSITRMWQGDLGTASRAAVCRSALGRLQGIL